jgi:Flavinator of succinate dehydrogenase
MDLPPPEPLPRHGESLETVRARLVYQSRKRGTLESDLLLSTFAQEHLGTMNAEELSEFDKVRAIYIFSSFFFVLMRRRMVFFYVAYG